jgi:hypothetical protein
VTARAHPQSDEAARSTSATPAHGAAAADRLRALQTTAGNAAVTRLLRTPATAPPKPSRITDTVTLTVTPLKPMSGPEFTVFVAARLQNITEQEAVVRHDELGGPDPHFTTGVAPAEVGRSIPIDVRLPALTANEAADIEGRGRQLAALPADDRRAIDEHADWDYQVKVGVRGAARPTQGPAAELWRRTRDEILRDRNRLDSLPEEIRAIVMPGGRRPDGEYGEALQLAARLGEFTWEDWALFQRRVGNPEADLRTTKAKVDKFTRRRASERAIVERIRGTEPLYDVLVRFNVARHDLNMTPEHYGQFPGYYKWLAGLAAAGFHGIADYENALADYYHLFQDRAGEIALEVLAASKDEVERESVRYGDPRAVAKLFAELAPLRALLADELKPRRGDGAGSKAPTPLDEAENERGRLAARYPSLADPELDTREDIGADTPDALGTALRSNAAARLKNIYHVRERIIGDPGAALQFDRVRDLTRQELGAGDKSVGARVVQSHVDDRANRERWGAQAQMLFALGFGMLTFGSGTLVVLGTAGDFAIGALQAHDEWERYHAAQAAAHSALDPEHALSTQDASGVWFALALIGAGLSAVSLTKALRSARPAIGVLEHTGDPVKFRAALDRARELTPGIRAALDRAGQAYAEFKAEWWALAGSSNHLGSIGGDLAAAVKGFKLLARHLARMGVRRFDLFMETLKAREELLAVLHVGEFTAEEEKQIKAAFKQGVAEYDATRPVIRVPFKKRERIITFRDEMLLDGKPITARERGDVLHKLGLRHTDDGHGVYQDAVTLADQAVDSAAAGNDGMIGQWASDEAMLGNWQLAQAEAAAGRGVRQTNGLYEVVIPARPDVGRVYVANGRLAGLGKTVTVRSYAPVAGRTVTEVAPNCVVAAFELKDGVYEIHSIYPAYKPMP